MSVAQLQFSPSQTGLSSLGLGHQRVLRHEEATLSKPPPSADARMARALESPESLALPVFPGVEPPECV